MTATTQPQQADRQSNPDAENEAPAEPRSFDLFGAPIADGASQEAEVRGSGASADDIEDESDPHQDALLDQGVEETFPASDPVSVKRIT